MNNKQDSIYVNLSFYCKKLNINDADVPCTFYANRVTPVLENAEDYKMIIARLNIDSQNLPILIPNIQTGQGNVNLTNYAIQINNLASVNLVYVPKNKYASSVPSVAGADSPYYWIYNIEDVVEMFNAACVSAVGSSGITPPFMIYNKDGTFSIYFDDSFVSTNSFYVNDYLFNLFRNFNYCYFSNNGINNKINVVNRLGLNAITINSIDYLIETQTYSSFAVDWTPVSSIVMTSSYLPIVSEERIPTINILTGGSNSSNDLEQQITDIVLSIDNPNDYNNNITYTATTDFRGISMNAREIREIQIALYWRSKMGVLYPLLMSDGNAGSIKLKFERIK